MTNEVRARLLDAALELMAARGYDNVGVQEIASAAGVTKPALYHYFGSKKGLIDTLMLESSGAFLETLRAEAQYAGDLPLSLERVARTYFGLATRQPQFSRLQLSMSFVPPESEARDAAIRFQTSQHAILEQLFLAAARDHGNMRGRHARYARAFLAVLRAHAAQFVDGEARPTERLRRELVHQFSHGIYS